MTRTVVPDDAERHGGHEDRASDSRRESPHVGRLSLATALLVTVSAFFGSVASAFVAFPQIASALNRDPEVTIAAPSQPTAPAEGMIVEGTSQGLTENELLWIATMKIGDGSYQPHNRPCSVSKDGNWVCPATFLGNAVDDRGRTSK